MLVRRATGGIQDSRAVPKYAIYACKARIAMLALIHGFSLRKVS
jgi:hypothetical protein